MRPVIQPWSEALPAQRRRAPSAIRGVVLALTAVLLTAVSPSTGVVGGEALASTRGRSHATLVEFPNGSNLNAINGDPALRQAVSEAMTAATADLAGQPALPVAAPAAGGATFSVRVIEAAKGPVAKMDPRLAQMKREFRPFQGQYNQFTLVRDQTLRLSLNQAGAVMLPKGQRFGLKMLGFANGKVRRIRYEVQLPRSRMKRSVAPGARTLDVIQRGGKLTIISTTVR